MLEADGSSLAGGGWRDGHHPLLLAPLMSLSANSSGRTAPLSPVQLVRQERDLELPPLTCKETSFLAPTWFPELSKEYHLQTLFMAEKSAVERKRSAPRRPGEMFCSWALHTTASPTPRVVGSSSLWLDSGRATQQTRRAPHTGVCAREPPLVCGPQTAAWRTSYGTSPVPLAAVKGCWPPAAH